MAGYSRQSVADIIANAVIKAAPVNAEYNAIRDAFAFSGGHKHDGSSTEGAYVPLIADTDALNKVVVDTTNNRISFYSEVSGVATEQVRIQDGAIVPVVDNDVDLGTSGLKFKNLYVDGIGEIGSVTILGGTIDNAVIGGTTPAAGTFSSLTATTADINAGTIDNTVIGATTPAAADFTTMDTSGNATVGGTLGVTGVTTLGTANITSVDLNSGAIDSTTIGAATPAAGTFTTLTANTSLTAASADINGGTIDGTTIGANSASTGAFTTLSATGTSTLSTVDINAGNIDGTTIGSSSAAAGSFTTVSTSGQATLATVDINGGAIDGATIGASSPAAITGTTITATSFVGPVTGNVTGNLTGNVTGDLTGNVTGNITASSGSSTFNNVTINGTLNMDAATTATITNLSTPVASGDAASKGYVDTQVANLVDSAPGTLDTLNELAAALGDDPNFSTTITNSIATKLPLAGGTMTGAIAMSTNKITGLGDPTAAQDAMTKAYADSNYLALSGGTMTGAIDMGSAKITTTYTPTNAADLTTKTYVDGILGSATAASASAAAAATSETNAATSETNAATSATAAASSSASAAASYDSFDDRYLGAKASAPTVDNDGDALITGALYFNTTTNIMNVYGSSGWQSAGSAVNGTSDRQTYTATSGQTVFAATYDTGYVDVYLNGVKLIAGTDFTATNGTSITLTTGAALNDVVDIVAYGTFVLADHYSSTQSDARYVEVAGDTMTGNLDVGGTVTADGLTVDGDATISSASPTLNLTDTGGVGTATINANLSNVYYTTPSSSRGHYFKTNAGSNDVLSITGGGDISFYEDTGTTPKFFWDASAERLGIGTTSPNVQLKLEHATRSSLALKDLSTNNELYAEVENGVATFNAYTAGTGAKVPIVFKQYTTERMRIDSSGNVGIGTSSPTLSGDYDRVLHLHSTFGTVLKITDATSGTAATDGTDLLNYGNDSYLVNRDAGNFVFGTSGTERMRIDSSGNLLVGKTASSLTNDGFQVHNTGYIGSTNSGASTAYFNRKTNDGDIINFQRDGTNLGSIASVAGTRTSFRSASTVGYLGVGSTDYYGFKSTAFVPTTTASYDLGGSAEKFKDGYFSGTVNAANFNTTSDATLKTNVETLTGSLDAVKALRGVSFDWIENGNSEVGVIAQEVEAVVPDVVSTNDQGIKSVKYGNIVAVLIEAIKEQQEQIDALKEQLNS